MPAAKLHEISDEISRGKDPAAALRDKVGDLSAIEVMGARVLIAVHIGSDKIAGSTLYRAPGNVKEDVYQGTVGLVLKKGPIAFVSDGANTFANDVSDGDWVVYNPGDTRRTQVNGVDCRLVEDTAIQMKITDPSIITHRQ